MYMSFMGGEGFQFGGYLLLNQDDKRRHEEEAQVDAEEQELAARRLFKGEKN